MGGEDFVQADDAEDSADLGGDGGQDDGGVGGESMVAGGDQGGYAAGVAEGQAAEVDDELLVLCEGQTGKQNPKLLYVYFPRPGSEDDTALRLLAAAEERATKEDEVGP